MRQKIKFQDIHLLKHKAVKSVQVLFRGIARIFKGSHWVTPRVLTRLSCRHPRCVLLKVAFFRMSSECGGSRQAYKNSCIDTVSFTQHKLLYYSLTAHQPKCLLVRQRGGGSHGHPRTPWLRPCCFLPHPCNVEL